MVKDGKFNSLKIDFGLLITILSETCSDMMLIVAFY